MKNNLWFTRYIIIILLVFFFSALAHALSAPSRLDARAVPNEGKVVLSWSAVQGAISFNLYRKEVTDAAYQRLNFSPVKTLSYEDKTVGRGKDYLYTVRTVDEGGRESVESMSAGAPLMTIMTSATITTLRDKPLEAKSIRTGKMVTFAAPGDIINYRITYANRGYGSARNVSINYDIPSGTVIAGPPLVENGASVSTRYYDRIKKQWSDKIENAENISRVKFSIAGDVVPVAKDKFNGAIGLNVVITI